MNDFSSLDDHLNESPEFSEVSSIDIALLEPAPFDISEYESYCVSKKLPSNDYFTDDGVKRLFDDYSGYDSLTASENRKLFTQFRLDPLNTDLESILVSGNLKLVLFLSRPYAARLNGDIDGIQDLVQEGTLGLLTAISKYDPTNKAAFSTYASWWIRQKFQAKIDKDKAVVIPDDARQALGKLLEAKRIFIEQHDREPSLEEIAEIIDRPVALLKRAIQAKNVQFVESLNNLLKTDESTELVEMIADTNALDPSLETANALISENIISALSVIPDDLTRLVIRYRYGLDNDTGRNISYEDIAEKVGKSPEAVRQIERKGIALLRRCPRTAMLLGAFDDDE